MEQSPQVVANMEQWFMTTQGATIYGVEPEGGEVESWKFTMLLRDVVYGLPHGVNHQEWKEWVELIYTSWTVSATPLHSAILSNSLQNVMDNIEGDDAGEIPVIIYRFLELYSKFLTSGETFDLRDILRYKVISDQPVVFSDLQQEVGEAWIDNESHSTFKALSKLCALFYSDREC